jgi:hypothetical protein
MSESKTSEKRLVGVQRQAAALELRKAGKGFQQIADELGYAGPSGAYRAVMTALQKTLQEPGEDLRRVEGLRLDMLLAALWSKAMEGDVSAVDRVLRVMERRAKLMGLDWSELYFENMALKMAITNQEHTGEHYQNFLDRLRDTVRLMKPFQVDTWKAPQ